MYQIDPPRLFCVERPTTQKRVRMGVQTQLRQSTDESTSPGGQFADERQLAGDQVRLAYLALSRRRQRRRQRLAGLGPGHGALGQLGSPWGRLMP